MARKPPTMRDIARLSGVSVMTVSRAFRADASVGADTRDRIMATAEALDYVFDSTAATLRSQRTGFVAVLIPTLNNANFAATVEAITTGLVNSGLQLLLAYTNYDMAKEEALIENLLRRRPEVIVLTGGQHTDRARRLIEVSGRAVIEIWDLPSRPLGHVVGFSNADSMTPLVDHLVATGRRRIAFLGGDAEGDTRGRDRRRGFAAAMLAHGLPADRLINSGSPPIAMHEGAVAMADLLVRFPDTDAVVCVSDLAAFGALTECQRRGVGVPRDIALAGFGAYDIAALCVPTLTTIDPAPARIGAETAALIRALRGPDPDILPRIVQIAPALVLGQSTGRAGTI